MPSILQNFKIKLKAIEAVIKVKKTYPVYLLFLPNNGKMEQEGADNAINTRFIRPIQPMTFSMPALIGRMLPDAFYQLLN